ncbi:MAG TPA: hypothetical protein PLI90_13315, partial [Rhodocyclaceae bacterium]|nr:hypothetical protein [Rhodocyclaceae bacterium]
QLLSASADTSGRGSPFHSIAMNMVAPGCQSCFWRMNTTPIQRVTTAPVASEIYCLSKRSDGQPTLPITVQFG